MMNCQRKVEELLGISMALYSCLVLLLASVFMRLLVLALTLAKALDAVTSNFGFCVESGFDRNLTH